METSKAHDGNASGAGIQSATAACAACRNMKMKCIRTTAHPTDPCDRCRRAARVCQVPSPRPLGRRKGARGRYHGVDKAVRNLQSEMRNAKIANPIEFQRIIQSAIDELPQTISAARASAEKIPKSPAIADKTVFTPQSADYFTTSPLPELGDKPISNPLALLADASDAARASESDLAITQAPPATYPESHGIVSVINPLERKASSCLGHRLLHQNRHTSLGLRLKRETLEHGLDLLFAPPEIESRYANYFRSLNHAGHQDVGPDVDPIALGLVTIEEAHYLFCVYFTQLHIMHGILDPVLHTPDFIRTRSALLFTWILAIAAQFDHSSAPLAQRLRLHGESLSRHVHTCGFKSVEIVQGYYISLLSATPAETLAEERSWLYTMYAFGVAAELGLDQKSESIKPQDTRCISDLNIQLSPSTRLAESQDVASHSSNESSSEIAHAQRLNRNRERTWLRILLWERANSAAYGRIHSFPETTLTANVGDWWMHPLADSTDKYTSAFITLRQHLASLHTRLREQKHLPQSHPPWIRNLIDDVLRPWCDSWLPQANTLEPVPLSERLSNTFLRYVYLHGRLWTLSIALHCTVNEGKDPIALQKDCFHAAVNACEVAVGDLQTIGEPLYSMLAPTWAMITYAAVLALNLLPAVYGSGVEDQVELFALLGQVAAQLERAGKTPSHRFGTAALLGQHLMTIVRAKSGRLKEVLDAEVCYTENRDNDRGALSHETCKSGSLDPLSSTYDPVFSTTLYDPMDEGFAGIFREIFGPGFGSVI